MLDSLKLIVQAVQSAESLQQTLEIIVNEVKAAMDVGACNVYLTADQELVLSATAGLEPDSVGKVRIPIEKGLVGMVYQKAETLNVADAQKHPNYHFAVDTGEKKFRGFLGVPIIHYRKCLGVLVVRKSQKVRFDEEQVAFLITLAAQLAGTISHAIVAGKHPQNQNNASGQLLYGQPASPGIAIGTVKVVYPLFELDAVPDRQAEDVDAEVQRFRQALVGAQKELEALSRKIGGSLPASERVLFDAYILILKSDSLVGETIDRIRQGQWAPAALRDTIAHHAKKFRQMDDVYFQERAEDLEDLGRRVLKHLQSEQQQELDYPERTVLISENVSASLLAEVPPSHIAAVVSAEGSGSSHVAILARALGVPAVMGVSDLPVSRIDNQTIVVDGYVGRVYVSPSEAILKEFKRLSREEEEMAAGLEALNDLPAITLDSEHIPLYANTGLLSDISPSLAVGAEGIGLYRTEFPFLIRERFPGEEEQRHIYQQVLQTFSPRPVVLRTLDIGGDKLLPYFPIKDENPFLGWRGIRVSLDHPEIFLTQIRAMLCADIDLGNLNILLPMVTNVAEVDDSLRLIRQAYDELNATGKKVNMPKVGVMIEVPSAVYMASQIAKRVDFLSIGTNDLIQYLLAVDRNNTRVASLYDSMEPAVLQALVQTVRGGHLHNKPVSVCGEMAGDPAAVLLLMGMGINSLSMSATSLPRIKWVIQSFSRAEARTVLEHALRMEDPKSIRNYLHSRLEDADLGGLVRAGK